MKNYKKIVVVCVCCALVMINNVYADRFRTHGFSYDETDYTNAEFTNGRVINVYDGSDLIGSMTSVFGKLDNKARLEEGKYEEEILCKMIMEPYANVNAKKWGVSEMCFCRTYLPSVDVNNWAPLFSVPSNQWFGYPGMESYLGAKTKILTDRVDIEGSMRSSERVFDVIYDYKPYKTRNPFDQSNKKNSYFSGISKQYSFASVNTAKHKEYKFDVKAKFTYAKDAYARPAYVNYKEYEEECRFVWKR